MIHISTSHFRRNLLKLKHELPLFDLTVYITQPHQLSHYDHRKYGLYVHAIMQMSIWIIRSVECLILIRRSKSCDQDRRCVHTIMLDQDPMTHVFTLYFEFDLPNLKRGAFNTIV